MEKILKHTEGEAIKIFLRKSDKDVAWLANELGVSDQAVYNQMKRTKLSLSFAQRLVERKINIFKDSLEINKPEKDEAQEWKKREIALQDEIISLQKRLITAIETIAKQEQQIMELRSKLKLVH